MTSIVVEVTMLALPEILPSRMNRYDLGDREQSNSGEPENEKTLASSVSPHISSKRKVSLRKWHARSRSVLESDLGVDDPIGVLCLKDVQIRTRGDDLELCALSEQLFEERQWGQRRTMAHW
jgi:hypothetical protein